MLQFLQSQGDLGHRVSGPLPSFVSGRPSVYLARRVTGDDGATIGYVVAGIALDYLETLYDDVVVQPGLSIRLWRDDGALMVISPPTATVGLKVGAYDFEAPKAGVTTLREGTDLLSHRPSYTAQYRLAAVPLVLTVVHEADLLYSGWRKSVAVSGGETVLFVVMIWVAAIFALRKVAADRALLLANQAAAVAYARAETLGRLDEVVEATGHVVFRSRLRADLTGERLFTSRNAHLLVGVSSQSMLGFGSIRPMLSSEAHQSYCAFLQTVRDTGRGDLTLQLQHPDKPPQWLRLRSTRVAEEPDEVIIVVTVAVDVTEEVEHRAEVEAVARLASLGEMASGIAHELSQPLGAIKLAAENAERELSREAFDPAAVMRQIERIGKQAERAGTIIHNLRAFGAGDRVTMAQLSLAAVVNGAMALVGMVLRRDGIDLDIAVDNGLPLIVGNRVAIEQVVVNLLLNARHAILDKRCPEQWVRVETMAQPDSLLLVVSDSGGGIPQSVLPRIFEPFFTTKGPTQGSGLGLSIARQAMTAMGGGIRAENGPVGACFRLQFRWADPARSMEGEVNVPTGA